MKWLIFIIPSLSIPKILRAETLRRTSTTECLNHEPAETDHCFEVVGDAVPDQSASYAKTLTLTERRNRRFQSSIGQFGPARSVIRPRRLNQLSGKCEASID
ncbi:MAG: hypothetical protein AAFV38_11875 [Pseudomonadota bacterium]